MSWKDSIKTVAPEESSWRDTIQEQPSELESLARGTAQGASFGFADEIAGALGGMYDDFSKALSGDQVPVDIKRDEFGNITPESLAEMNKDASYEKRRDAYRNADRVAQEANPTTYGAGEIGGAIGTAFIPGMGVLNAGKGANLATKIGMGAVQGGLTGAGQSEADDLMGLAKDTGTGAVLGGALTGVGEKVVAPALNKVGNALSKSGDAADYLLAKMGKVGANVPEEYTERYLKNPNAIRNAMSKEDLAASLLDETGGLSQLKENIGKADALAWSKLDTDTVIPKAELLDDVAKQLKGDILNEYGNLSRTEGFGASYQKIRAIDDELEKIGKAYGKNISEADLKAIVQDLRSIAYSYEGSPKYTHQGEGLRRLASTFDTYLKGGNKDYEALMEPVADKTRLLKDLERNFINKQDPDSYDKFFQKIKRWGNAEDASSMKSGIKRLDDVTGTSIGEDINNTLTKDAFSKSDTNGSRKTMFGTVIGGGAGSLIGGPVGGVVGSAIGAATGQIADKYAGAVMRNILDGRIAAGEGLQAIAPKLGKYAKPLMEAAQRGNKSLAATHFLLSQQDPEYRKITQDEE